MTVAPPIPRQELRSGAAQSSRVTLFSAPTPRDLADSLARGRGGLDGGPARAAIFDPTEERLARARSIAERGISWRGRDGIWFSPSGLVSSGGTLVFMFPGVDGSFEPRVDDVAHHFGLPVPECTTPRDLQETGVGIVGVNRLLDRVVRGLGIVPNDVAGHSVGEWSGMIATGVIPDEAVDSFIARLQPGSLHVPGVVFATAGCGSRMAAAALEGLDDIALSHDNCPHQVLVCGVEPSVDAALARLRADGVLCQKLPFQSGFHSPLFAAHVGPHRENFARLPLRSPLATLWSATTCAPYPEDLDGIRALAVEHLVRPVRFRELVEVLYAKGARVFLQVGTGSLVQFVEDTLRGRPHLAIAANVKERTGMDQLKRAVAALFVEGAGVDVSLVLPESFGPTLPSAHPILAEFVESMTAIADAQREVVTRYIASHDAAKSPTGDQGEIEAVATRELSVETLPELSDHALVRQPPDWPILSDREPLVPMTTLVDLMIEHAQVLCPGRVAVGVEQVRAHRWLGVAPAVTAKISCRLEQAHRVHVAIDDYCEGTVVFSDRYPIPPLSDTSPLVGATRASMSARAVYDEHWLFHGPAFQGIVDLGVLGDEGIRGTLQTGQARGALLDNAGQLFGCWVMMRHETDRMAMPVRLSQVRFFGPHPRPGERLECTVRVRSIDERSVVADLTLARDGHLWAAIDGWENRRFETNDRFWSVIRWPEKTLLSEVLPEGFVVFEDRYRAGPTRERLARRFLGERERIEYEQKTPRRQRCWLAGRIAAKDAVRDLLWRMGHGPIFPIEIGIANEPSGRPVARTPTGRDVSISIAHKNDVAVAIACEGGPAGIDIERIEPRAESFAELSFTKDELRLVEGEPRDEGWTRLWTAKEAAAKAAGTGLSGSPGRFPIRDRAGRRLLVGKAWVDTQRYGDFVIAWVRT